MLVTLMFSVFDRKSRTSSSFPVQLTSRCAGAGTEHSQAASPSWAVEIFHTINVELCL